MVTIQIRENENVHVMDLHGKLLADHENSLWKAVQFLVVEKGARQILINFENVPVCDSYGIGELLRLHDALRNMGGKIVLFSVPPLIERVFEITQVKDVFNIAKDEAAAMRTLLPLVLVD